LCLCSTVYFARAFAILINLSNDELKIIFRSDLIGEKDSILFYKTLHPTDTLQKISDINLHSLKEYYSNDCVEDGSQVTVSFKINGKAKSVHLSNFYQEDVGEIIYLINSLVPNKYKIWYDKEKLTADEKKCRENRHAVN